LCPLDPTNIANAAQNESSSFSAVAICNSCNEEGHSRKRCKLYSRPGNLISLEPVPKSMNRIVMRQMKSLLFQLLFQLLHMRIDATSVWALFIILLIAQFFSIKSHPIMISHNVGRDFSASQQILRHEAGRMKVECASCRALMWIEERTNKGVRDPIFHMCCGKGRYVLQRFSETPTLQSKEFKKCK
jgi:hypothetical protein